MEINWNVREAVTLVRIALFGGTFKGIAIV